MIEGARRRGSRSAAADPDRPTTAPPSSTANNSAGGASVAAEASGAVDFSDLEFANVDTEMLFHGSTDWNILGKAMAILQDQYDQCLQDIAGLEALRADALGDPESFISSLQIDRAFCAKIPTLQTIYRCPEIDVDRFSGRLSRRGMNKKEQNAELLIGRVKELQQRGAVVIPVPCRSDELSIGGSGRNVIHNMANAGGSSSSNNHRDRFMSVLNSEDAMIPHRSATSTPLSHCSSSTNTSAGTTATNHASSSLLASPKPSKRQRKADQQQPTSPRKRQAEHNVTYNVPWTNEENRRLSELLVEYPEEPVASRRYAKIAAALGTRTPTQVFTRVAKLLTTKRSSADPLSTVTGDGPAEASAEYREYVKLKTALEQELSGTGSVQVHCGVHCSVCNAHPIIGTRYRCLDCNVDFCDICFTTPSHSSHRIQAAADTIDYLQ